jgi:transposase-like protein
MTTTALDRQRAAQSKVQALAMLRAGATELEVCAELAIRPKTLRQWVNEAEKEAMQPARGHITPAPYRVGYAGWGRWR